MNKRRTLLSAAATGPYSKSLDDVQLSIHQKYKIKVPWRLKKVGQGV